MSKQTTTNTNINTPKAPEPRYRNWGLVLYPESAPSNWEEILIEEGVPFAYILHDKDQYVDENGEIKLKKAHYQIIMKYKNQKTKAQMADLTKRKLKVSSPAPIPLGSLEASARDLLHLDQRSPLQHKYDLSEVQVILGLDFQYLIRPTKTEQNAIMRDIRHIIREHEINEISDLWDFLDEINPFYSMVLDAKTYAISSYINSCRHKPKKRRDVTKVS